MPRTRQPIVILGTHLLAQELHDLIDETEDFVVAGFVENLDRSRVSPLNGLPVHWIDDVQPLAKTHLAVCGISTTHRGEFVRQAADAGLRFAVVVHPTARVSERSTLGEGTIVGPGSIIASHTTIGRHVFINRGVLIGHHTQIGDFATIQPGANIAGACSIGERAYIAMGSVVIDRKAIGAGSVVGAGAVVVSDVPAACQVMGVPARVVKENIDGK